MTDNMKQILIEMLNPIAVNVKFCFYSNLFRTLKFEFIILWKFTMYFIFYNFLLDLGPFCGTTGTLCFRLWMTLPMSIKLRVDPSPQDSVVACEQ